MKQKNVFRSYTFRWWQLILYEIALFSLGFGVGGFWPDAAEWLMPLSLLVFVIIAPYIFYLYLAQSTDKKQEAENKKQDQ